MGAKTQNTRWFDPASLAPPRLTHGGGTGSLALPWLTHGGGTVFWFLCHVTHYAVTHSCPHGEPVCDQQRPQLTEGSGHVRGKPQVCLRPWPLHSSQVLGDAESLCLNGYSLSHVPGATGQPQAVNDSACSPVRLNCAVDVTGLAYPAGQFMGKETECPLQAPAPTPLS